MNKRSKDLSKNLIEVKLQPTETIYCRRNKTLLVGYKQKKTRKPVYMLTTALAADDTLIKSKKSGIEAIKPKVIGEYNLNMGGVDLKDKSIYHLTCTRATRRYWRKLFDNFLDMSLLNCYILYKSNTDDPLSRHLFTVEIVESLVKDNPPQQIPHQPHPGPGGDGSHNLVRLTGVKLRVCVVCSTSEKQSRSRYWCPGCRCGVHPGCFSNLEHYLRPIAGGRRKKRARDQESDSD